MKRGRQSQLGRARLNAAQCQNADPRKASHTKSGHNNNNTHDPMREPTCFRRCPRMAAVELPFPGRVHPRRGRRAGGCIASKSAASATLCAGSVEARLGGLPPSNVMSRVWVGPNAAFKARNGPMACDASSIWPLQGPCHWKAKLCQIRPRVLNIGQVAALQWRMTSIRLRCPPPRETGENESIVRDANMTPL